MMNTEAHKAYAGLWDVAYSKGQLKKLLNVAFKKALKNDLLSPDNKIRIIDTFFSDTIEEKLLEKLFYYAGKSQRGYKIEILLLDPLGESAEHRERELDQDRPFTHRRTITGLEKILKALNGGLDIESEKAGYPKAIIHHLLHAIRRKASERSVELEIKFSFASNFPLYIFGNYACSGHFLSKKSAIHTPWYFWLNNPLHDNDQFDLFVKHHERVFFTGSTSKQIEDLIEDSDKVFISHGHSDILVELISKSIRESGFQPFTFKDLEKKRSGLEISETLKKLYTQGSAAIILLTGDDQIHTVEGSYCQPRPNVLIELGVAQAIYPKNILLLQDEAINKETISNLSNHLPQKIDRQLLLDESQTEARENFSKVIKDFLEKVRNQPLRLLSRLSRESIFNEKEKQ